MKITVEELMMLLGQRDVEIYLLQKQITEANKKIAELKPKQE